MEKLIDKVKFFFSNKRNVVFFSIGVLVLVIILLMLFKGDDDVNFFVKSDSDEFASEYEKLNGKLTDDGKEYPKVKLPDSDLIKYVTIEEVLNVFNNSGDAVIYFGYSTCLYCRNAVQILLDTAVDTELDELFYMNIEDYWDVLELDENNKVVTVKEAHGKYYDLLDKLGKELVNDYILTDGDGKEISTGNKRIQIPLVIFVTDGRVVSYNIGTLHSQEDPYVEMDDSQKSGLSYIYRYGIRDVVESKKQKGLLK